MPQFLAAEEHELQAIEEREVIERGVPVPACIKPIGCRFVFTWKYPVSQENVEPGKFIAKAKLTMKDFKRHSDNLREMFAPTGRGITFRLLFAITTIMMMSCHHIDVSTAFLYADLVNGKFMEAAPGRSCGLGMCYWAVKAFMDAVKPREWNKLLTSFILSIGFAVSLLELERVCSSSLYMWMISYCSEQERRMIWLTLNGNSLLNSSARILVNCSDWWHRPMISLN